MKGRHVRNRRHRGLLVAGVVFVLLAAALGGGAYAAYRYEQSNSDRILPGVRIAGIDVGGMTRAEAERAVKEKVDEVLGRSFTVAIGETRWIVTQADLGRKAHIDAALDAALAAGSSMGSLDRFWHRVRDESIEVDIDLRYSFSGDGVARFVGQISEEVFVQPRDAAFGITEDGSELIMKRGRDGKALNRADAGAQIREAISSGRARLDLDTSVLPAARAAELGRNIVVRVDQNRLYLYEGFEIIGKWDVATGKPGYTTPTGVWNIWDMRENPTWYNPALDSWGAGLPAVVPGGPNAPMGTRAIYIDAPGLIRVHGTPDDSSIGRYASHGCIRMHNWEIEELFEMIDIGQEVIIVGHRPANASYWDTPGLADI